jgi:GMP synthase-like glutamine amidotransferase
MPLQADHDQTMRLGILETDSVREELQREFGDYPAMFRAVLSAGADGLPVAFRDYDVQRGEYPASLDECDAYLITGSRESVYDDQPWIHRLARFVQELDAARHTLVGICFGHQLIAHVLGGETRAADVGWAVGVQETCVLSPAEWMRPYRQHFGLLSSHKDQVVRLPERAEVFAATPICPNSGFTIGGHILTFQGHPEFSKGYSRALIELRRELLGEPRYSAGVESLAKPVHQSMVGHWIINFIASNAADRTHESS